MEKLDINGIESELSPREKAIITFIETRPGSKSGEIATRLNIPNPTLKKILSELVSKNLIQKYGVGPGTNYSIK